MPELIRMRVVRLTTCLYGPCPYIYRHRLWNSVTPKRSKLQKPDIGPVLKSFLILSNATNLGSVALFRSGTVSRLMPIFQEF